MPVPLCKEMYGRNTQMVLALPHRAVLVGGYVRTTPTADDYVEKFCHLRMIIIIFRHSLAMLPLSPFISPVHIPVVFFPPFFSSMG